MEAFIKHTGLVAPLDLSNVVDEFEVILAENGIHKLPDNFS